MRKIMVLLAFGIACVVSAVFLSNAQSLLNASDLETLIMSASEKERVSARQMILDNKEALAQNKELIEDLISIVRRPVIEGEPFYSSTTSRNIVIFLLGKLRAKEAVPVLINWLVPKKGQGMKVSELLIVSPAGYALVEIGLPSVSPLIEKLKSEGTSILGKECLKVIVRIKGLEETELVLQTALSEETDHAKETNLKAALELIENPNSVLRALDESFKKAFAKAKG